MLAVCLAEAGLKVTFIGFGILHLFVVLLDIWYFTILLACYRYLRDKLVAVTPVPTAYEKLKIYYEV